MLTAHRDTKHKYVCITAALIVQRNKINNKLYSTLRSFLVTFLYFFEIKAFNVTAISLPIKLTKVN